jgi:hypothetical protein
VSPAMTAEPSNAGHCADPCRLGPSGVPLQD